MRIRNFVLASMVLWCTGCASLGQKWKSLISGGPTPEQQAELANKNKQPTYSEQSDLMPSAYRKYKRSTKKDLQDEAKLDSRAGSLWVMEGQGAYLFAQNVVRMVGDPIGIRIEGDPRDQLSQKSQVIGDLLKQLEERRKKLQQQRLAEGTKEGENKPADAAATAAPAANPDPALAAAANPTNAARAPASADKDFSVKSVPTRIVERLVDGNYRVRGTQPFMIGNREYRVIVSGIVRAEDFNEEGISATQLLDPNFDIVSSKSTEIR